MKHRNHLRRFGALMLAMLMAAFSLAACTGGGAGGDTTAGETSAATEEGTTDGTSSVGNPQDTPKAGDYITTTDLILPDYTYAVDSLDNNGIIPTTRDVWTDTWTGTDGADRSMPAATDTRAPTRSVSSTSCGVTASRTACPRSLPPITTPPGWRAVRRLFGTA